MARGNEKAIYFIVRVSASLYLVTFMPALCLLAQLVCANVLSECLIERNDSKQLL